MRASLGRRTLCVFPISVMRSPVTTTVMFVLAGSPVASITVTRIKANEVNGKSLPFRPGRGLVAKRKSSINDRVVFTLIPQKIERRCWLDGLALPHGRDEKTKNQTHTFPVQPPAADLQPVSWRVIARAVLDAAPPRFLNQGIAFSCAADAH